MLARILERAANTQGAKGPGDWAPSRSRARAPSTLRPREDGSTHARKPVQIASPVRRPPGRRELLLCFGGACDMARSRSRGRSSSSSTESDSDRRRRRSSRSPTPAPRARSESRSRSGGRVHSPHSRSRQAADSDVPGGQQPRGSTRIDAEEHRNVGGHARHDGFQRPVAEQRLIRGRGGNAGPPAPPVEPRERKAGGAGVGTKSVGTCACPSFVAAACAVYADGCTA